jgi:fatty-acyl-CoA synthase
MNLATLLTQTARRLPDHLSLVWGDHRWTWSGTEARVRALTAGLATQGVGKGTVVLVHSRNSNELFELMFALFRLGAIFAPTNFRLTPSEVADLADLSGATIFCCQSDFPDHAAAVSQAMPGLKATIRMGAGTSGSASFGQVSLADLIAAHRDSPAPPCPVDRDDPCWFFFTSGTTGRSKAAVLTHGQMAFVVTNHLADLMPGLTEADASLVVAPLSHGAGVHALMQVARGARSVLMPGERFDIPEAWRLIGEHRISNMFTVPTILKMLAEHPAAASADTSSLRHVIYAGAPMYREDQKMILNRLGKVIVQYFGLGEVTGNITVLPPRLHEAEDGPGARIGTCGFPRTGIEVTIQNDAGEILAPHETGEICCIGPAVFAGYHNNPDANAKSFRDGWLRTGDLGHVDEEGFVYITGRASDMYISGGSNIYPREIEEKLLKHPDIVEAAVLGVPDPQWGEVGIAALARREGSALSEEEIAIWLSDKLARYKLPRRFVFFDALPKSGYGKVPKRLVRDELVARGVIAPGKP